MTTENGNHEGDEDASWTETYLRVYRYLLGTWVLDVVPMMQQLVRVVCVCVCVCVRCC